MGENDEKKGIRQIRSHPRPERVDASLANAIETGVTLLASHEPVIKEVHDAFLELGERIHEAQDTRAEIARMLSEPDPDQEGINSLLKGAEQTRRALLSAILLARAETEK